MPIRTGRSGSTCRLRRSSLASPRVGVVGLPGKWSTEALADAVQARTGQRLVVNLDDVTLDLASGRLDAGGADLCELDALVVKKVSRAYSPSCLDRIELLRHAEGRGVRVFSPAAQLLRLVNRLSCTVTLRAAGVPMPDTRVTGSVDVALSAVRDFGSAILKPLYSTKAQGMCVLQADQSESDLRAQIRDYQAENPVLYIQRRIELPGRDLGLVFLGGKFLCAYARVSAADSWNTTIQHGGRYAACEPDADLIEIARRAQAPFALDFTTVDVAESSTGPVVFEVSAFGGFRGALEGAGVDAAAAYADHLLGQLGV